MKKRALNRRVLYKISHLTISSLVVISNKRQGQLNLCYQLETIHLRWKRSQLRETFADKVMLECCYQLCAFASADSKFFDLICLRYDFAVSDKQRDIYKMLIL